MTIGDEADALELLVDLLAAPLFYRRLVVHHPIPAALPDATIDSVLVERDADVEDQEPCDRVAMAGALARTVGAGTF